MMDVSTVEKLIKDREHTVPIRNSPKQPPGLVSDSHPKCTQNQVSLLQLLQHNAEEPSQSQHSNLMYNSIKLQAI